MLEVGNLFFLCCTVRESVVFDLNAIVKDLFVDHVCAQK